MEKLNDVLALAQRLDECLKTNCWYINPKFVLIEIPEVRLNCFNKFCDLTRFDCLSSVSDDVICSCIPHRFKSFADSCTSISAKRFNNDRASHASRSKTLAKSSNGKPSKRSSYKNR